MSIGQREYPLNKFNNNFIINRNIMKVNMKCFLISMFILNFIEIPQ